MGLIKMAAAGAAGYALYKYATNKEAKAAHAGDGQRVRDAGPENMQDKPVRWSKTDEAIDESFPASDPPATY
ncbi:MAG: hypothetical protein CMH85_11445 [Novosphingobium sp.]|jgi:hypothetical protein|uniref:Uncharacterized protein n=1 Tax=Novosphingobium indicum TaxID=462949 RepID=A0ABQ2J6F0_9SPHN|nr:hypothetical protein [Novosphingobium indicum]MAC58863.1 hypothetical protein [Novosphingobium sp.]GGN41182.1 hypothetical protein GCM10011349_02920 [Novosphingobium indicum]